MKRPQGCLKTTARLLFGGLYVCRELLRQGDFVSLSLSLDLDIIYISMAVWVSFANEMPSLCYPQSVTGSGSLYLYGYLGWLC